MRVKGYNPDRSDAQTVTDPDPESWYVVRAIMTKDEHIPVEVTLLRPAEWFVANEVALEQRVWLDLPEMQVSGWAEVLSIVDCPPIAPGFGPVVTRTFKHDAAATISLRFADQSDEVRCTTEHPFWSETQQAFLPANELTLGEEVATSSGHPALLTSIVPRAGPETVYGLEIYGEHVYHVSTEGVLTHNASSHVSQSQKNSLAPSKR